MARGTSLASFRVTSGGGSLVGGDFDGDGAPDLAMPNTVSRDEGTEISVRICYSVLTPPYQVRRCQQVVDTGVPDGLYWQAGGDFDADGFDDVVVDVPSGFEYGPASWAVLGGGPSGLSLNRVDAADLPYACDPFDVEESGLDVNADGYSDVLLVNPVAEEETGTGEPHYLGEVVTVRAFLGGPDGLPTQAGAAVPSFAFGLNTVARDITGVDIADYDGDGVADMATTEEGADSSGDAVQFVPGPLSAASEPAYTFLTTGLHSQYPRHGDVNGDGYTDVVADERVIAGCADGLGPGVFSNFEDAESWGNATILDVDGDGYADMVTDQQGNYIPPPPSAPYSYVYWGGPDAPLSEWTGLDHGRYWGLGVTTLRAGGDVLGFALLSEEDFKDIDIWRVPTPPDEPPNPAPEKGSDSMDGSGGNCGCAGSQPVGAPLVLALAMFVVGARRDPRASAG